MGVEPLTNRRGRFANHVDMTSVDLRTLPEVFRTVRNMDGDTIIEYAVRMAVPFKLELPITAINGQVTGFQRQVGKSGDFLVQGSDGVKYIVNKDPRPTPNYRDIFRGRYELLEYHLDLETSMRTVAQIGQNVEAVIELLRRESSQ